MYTVSPLALVSTVTPPTWPVFSAAVPPTGVAGAPPAPGIPGTFGTTTRTDGTKQVTWNGHPLYTYVADSGPGQAHGNNLNLNGGLWREIVVNG